MNYVLSEHDDVDMNFLHPKSLSEKLFWLQCDDVCWIQFRMYTVKLMHFQPAVLDSFIFLTKKKENIETESCFY